MYINDPKLKILINYYIPIKVKQVYDIPFCFYVCHDIIKATSLSFESWKTMPKGFAFGIYVLMLFVPLFWGGAFVAAEHVITEIPPLIAAAFRFLMAGLLLLIIQIGRASCSR